MTTARRIAWMGIVVLNVAGTSPAAIVYRDIPDTHLTTYADLQQFIDADLDGVPDFLIGSLADCPSGCGVSVVGLNGGRVSLEPPDANGRRWVSRLGAGSLIGARGPFTNDYGTFGAQQFGLPYDTPWLADPSSGYFPVSFLANGEVHFGWFRAQGLIDHGWHFALNIFDFAYEDTPNTPIAAGAVPAPGHSVMLVVGAMTMVRRPRRR